MYEISRNEEHILLAIWRLKNNAYGVTIRKMVTETTKKTLHFGSLYNTLDLLIRKGLVIMQKSDPRSVRGGRSKKLYYLTTDGKKALKNIQEMQKSAWDGISDAAFESE